MNPILDYCCTHLLFNCGSKLWAILRHC